MLRVTPTSDFVPFAHDDVMHSVPGPFRVHRPPLPPSDPRIVGLLTRPLVGTPGHGNDGFGRAEPGSRSTVSGRRRRGYAVGCIHPVSTIWPCCRGARGGVPGPPPDLPTPLPGWPAARYLLGTGADGRASETRAGQEDQEE